MKCIKAIRSSKNHEVGDIIRIDDVESEIKVKGGFWVYTSKTEWKKSKKPVEVKTIVEPKTKEEIIPGQGAQRIPPKKEKFKKGNK